MKYKKDNETEREKIAMMWIEEEEEKEIKFRKANYWRGFRACLILVVFPIVLGLVVLANIFINNNI